MSSKKWSSPFVQSGGSSNPSKISRVLTPKVNSNSSTTDLPGEVYGQFLDISKIAYNGICAESESVATINIP